MYRDKLFVILLIGLIGIVSSAPQQPKSKRPAPVFKKTAGLELPDNATLIRENIVDTFSCKDRIYGYYADMENECQIFHVCLPQARGATRWSFICPAETVFNQATFVCTRTESSIPCEESERYYILNEEIGKEMGDEEEDITKPPDADSNDIEPISSRPLSRTSKILRGKSSRRQ